MAKRQFKTASVLVILLCISTKGLTESNPEYNVQFIPKELRLNADAIIRKTDVAIEVKAIDWVVYRKKMAVTIMNSAGEGHASIEVYYNNGSQIRTIHAILYDKNGDVVWKIPQSKFKDISE